MPKVSRGGKRSATQSAFSYQNAAGTATPQQAQELIEDLEDGDIISYSDYMKLSDDEKAEALETILRQGLPNFLDNDAVQKLVYYTDIEGKPNLISENALNKMSGKSLYRTVHSVYDRNTDVNYSAKEIYDQITRGDVTRLSGDGSSAYGTGLYFADSYSESRGYRNPRARSNLTMKAKLNNNARVISESAAVSGVRREINSGSKLGKVYSKMKSRDRASVWALNNGYNVVQASYTGYYIVLDRSAMSVSTKTVDPIKNTRW